jgi:ABC-2 type transport system permease protein
MDPIRLWAVARKEWTQLRRDPRSMAMAFLLPLLMLVFFGYAITWDVDDIRIAVLDQDRTRPSRELIQTLEASGYFTVQEYLGRYGEIDEALIRGEVLGVVAIPPGFARELAAGRGAQVQMLLDGSDANTATIALNYGDAIVARYSREVILQGQRLTLPVAPESRIWYNPTLESRNMIVPALIAVIMSVIAAMLTSLTIAREWERGTMEQLASTPVRRFEVVAGKLLPYLFVGMFDVALTVVAGILLFGAPLRGSVLLLAGLTLLFLVGALGMGLFISAALKAQVLATQIGLISTFLPAVLLSGFIFDIASMPIALRAVSLLVPARYFVVVTRGIFLKGVGPGVLWIQALLMIAFAVLGLSLATWAFKKELG